MAAPDLRRVESVHDEFNELDEEYKKLQSLHATYLEKIKAVKALQDQCTGLISKQRYRMKKIAESLSTQVELTESELKRKTAILDEIAEKKQQFRSMEEFLPHKNGVYLNIILGQVNVSLLSKADRLNYKQNYENFKLVLNIITFILSCILLVAPFKFRMIDAAYHFLFVWYYCTLTIREHILKVNGSKIKGWWMLHHFITTLAAGIFLVWPEGASYWSFRSQFVIFCTYLSVVQVVMFYYQSGILYRLRALGLRNDMDITLEGFHSWMFRGFSFLLPFLFFGYTFQFYNSYTLYKLWLTPECTEWQVPFLSAIFLLLGSGNTWTTLLVVKNRYLSKFSDFFARNQYRLDVTKTKDI
ncbi:ion channel TACAN-like [Watersipora subatra]|uniref:ion channel TACAN-like n=1 Tax=Watersipora subatra TaxID=2589382 RepID=UPI00355B5C39